MYTCGSILRHLVFFIYFLMLLLSAMKLGQGYIFTGICDSVHGGMCSCRGVHSCQGTCVVAGGCAWLPGGMHDCWGHAWLPGGMHGCQGACMVAGEGVCGCQGGMHGGHGGMHRIQRDTVNEWAVRILLECILVKINFHINTIPLQFYLTGAVFPIPM